VLSEPTQDLHIEGSSRKNNSAVLHFTGKDTQKNDQRKYESWYSIDTLIYLANMNLPATFQTYIFHSENSETKFISFENQLRHLISYKKKLPPYTIISFIAFEAARFATSHFIVGVLVDDILLFINPLGKNKPDFYQYLSEIQATLLNNYTIYVSHTIIQKDEEGIVSCGPLCVEVVRHITALTSAACKDSLLTCQSSVKSEQGLQFHQADIFTMLPENLQHLASLARGDPAFRIELEEIRKKHFNMLVDLNDIQCENLKNSTVQINIFETMREEEETRIILLKLAEEERYQPDLKIMNKALEYMVFSLEQIVEDLQKGIFANTTPRWQMFSKTLVFLQNHFPQYFLLIEKSWFLPDDKIIITVILTISCIRNYTDLFGKLFDCFRKYSPKKSENINIEHFSQVILALRKKIQPLPNFVHQNWASTNLTKLEAVLLPLQLDQPLPARDDRIPLIKPVAKHSSIPAQPLVRSCREDINCSIEFMLICLENFCTNAEYFSMCLTTIFNYLDRKFYKEFSFFRQALPPPHSVVKIMSPDNADERLNEIFIAVYNYYKSLTDNYMLQQDPQFLSDMQRRIVQIRKNFGKLEDFDVQKFAAIELHLELDIAIFPSQFAIPTLLNNAAVLDERTNAITTESLGKEIHSFLEAKSDESRLDPFYWQIDQLYRGGLRTLDRVTIDELDRIINCLINSIKQLDAEGFFKNLEQDVRECVHSTLRNHLVDLLSYEEFKKEQQAIENYCLERQAEIAARRTEYEEDPDSWEYDYEGLRYPSDIEYSSDAGSSTKSSGLTSENYSDKSTYSDDSEKGASKSDSDNDNSTWCDNGSDRDYNSEEDNHAYRTWYDEKNEELGDLDDLQKVISICTGPEGLDWLVHQYAEYGIEVSESLIKEIRIRNMSLEPEVVIFILQTMFMERGYDAKSLHEDGFAAKAFIESLIDMGEGNSADEESPFITTKLHILRKINSRFARLKDLIQQGKLETLRQVYNRAHVVNNHFEMQKCWYIFTKVQRLLRSAEGSRTTTPLPLVGKDYSFKRGPLTYEQLLQMAYEAYEARSISLHYRIFPTKETRYLAYRSRKKPYSAVTLDVMAIFEELATVGIKVENILRKHNQDFTNNIIVPTFYFIVSDIPHQKGEKHSRKFILVDLKLPGMEFLLSNDRDDGIFPRYNEEQFLRYRAENADKDYEEGCKIINVEKKKARQPPCSEKGLFELLQRRPEIVNYLVQEMKKALPPDEQGKYKIYGGGIISYSTNSTCDFCTLSYIALQNSYHAGFLANFIKIINIENSQFKTRGFDKGQPKKFIFHTLVQFKECYTVQALDLHDLTSQRIEKMKDAEIPIYRNPDAKLHFTDNTVEIYKPASECDVPNVTLIEFIRPTIQPNTGQMSYNNHIQRRFTFYGHTFMSGSKKRDFPSKASEINLTANQMIKEHREMPRVL
jgi:hypothetical protein